MRATTIIILLLSLISCGKRVKRVKEVQDSRTDFYQCSTVQWANNCTYRPVDYRLQARDFYARYCYREYSNCLKQRGL